MQAVASTTSENYKDDEAYHKYRELHEDVPDGEREFFKTLIHFQTQGLQIFERKQHYIQQLKGQVKSQEEMNRALETSRAHETELQWRVQEAEQKLQHLKEEHLREIEAKEEELKQLNEKNAKLIRDKEHITHQHIQEAYQMNMSLHCHTMETTL